VISVEIPENETDFLTVDIDGADADDIAIVVYGIVDVLAENSTSAAADSSLTIKTVG
jgi:hypothetical protein